MDANRKKDLALELQKDVLQRKAKELGVDVSDLTSRTWDGKTQIVKKSTVYDQLDASRKLVAPKKVMRAIRGGQDSLVSNIRLELETTRNLIQELATSHQLQAKELNETKALLIKVENQTLNSEKLLRDIEEKIENIKMNTPVFDKAAKILDQIKLAKKKKELETVKNLQLENQDLLQKYFVKHKTLEPSIKATHKHRGNLQKQFWTVLQIHYKLGKTVVANQIKMLAVIGQSFKPASPPAELIKGLINGQKSFEKAVLTHRELVKNAPASSFDSIDSIKVFDKILPEMKLVVELLSEVKSNYASLLFEHQAKASKRDTSRMATATNRKRT